MPDMPRNGIYRMPSEWEPQKSTWIAWPHNKEDWPGKFNEIPWVFSKIIAELSKVQLVNILVQNKSDRKERNKCPAAARAPSTGMTRVSLGLTV